MDFRFDQPWFLLGVLLIPAVMAWRRWGGRAPVWLVPYASAWAARARMPSGSWRLICLYAAIVVLSLAAARPQRTDQRQEVVSRGYDLMLAIDLSTSMLAEDYTGPDGKRINRMDALKPIIQSFIASRKDDRIGVVLFAAKADTLAPLTTDHAWLARQVDAMRIGMLEDGTAIGDGLGIALTNLEDRNLAPEAASVGKFVILLTDGANTSGSLTPPQSTGIAKFRGVPVYTIAAGRNGMVPFPIFDDYGRRIGTRMFPSSLDIEAMKTMAAETGGHFSQAGDVKSLDEAFKAIDRARKTEFRVSTRLTTTELFPWFLAPGLALMLLAAPVWGAIRWRRPRLPLQAGAAT
jgi:Ca-activated chloride channel family protein